MADAPVTLSQHLASQSASVPAAHAPGVAAVIGRIGRIAAVIAQELAHAALRDRLGYVGGVNVSGDAVKKLDLWGHETMLAGLRGTGACAAFISEEATEPVEIPEAGGMHSVVVCCDPVDLTTPAVWACTPAGSWVSRCGHSSSRVTRWS